MNMKYVAVLFGVTSVIDLGLAFMATSTGLGLIYLLLSAYFAFRAKSLWNMD